MILNDIELIDPNFSQIEHFFMSILHLKNGTYKKGTEIKTYSISSSVYGTGSKRIVSKPH
ncbi:MAG: hypothetical protein CM15mP86_18330 [Gammaproteobacteria bacterium]|nr:MAG: hypothetical protein CM15mP86_18330 [Gammaproteobacteria bacterium]